MIRTGQLIRLQPNTSQPDSPYFKKGPVCLVVGSTAARGGYTKVHTTHRGKEEYMFIGNDEIAEVLK